MKKKLNESLYASFNKYLLDSLNIRQCTEYYFIRQVDDNMCSSSIALKGIHFIYLRRKFVWLSSFPETKQRRNMNCFSSVVRHCRFADYRS